MTDCMFCTNLAGKQFCIANMQYEEAEYRRVKDMVVRWILSSWSSILERMAQLTRDDILKLARLARLELSEDEIIEYGIELSGILQYVEQLQQIDVAGLEPTNQVTGLVNVTRADEIHDYGYVPADLLSNVPATKGGQIQVKRMLG